MREFILARAGQGLRRKMGLGEAANISSKIPVGSVTVDCGLAWDQGKNMWSEPNGLGTTGSGRTWVYECLCQIERF